MQLSAMHSEADEKPNVYSWRDAAASRHQCCRGELPLPDQLGPSPTVMVPLGTLVRVSVPLTAKAADVVVAGG